MKRMSWVPLCMLILIVGTGYLHAGVTTTIQFDPQDLHIKQDGEYTHVEMVGCSQTGQVGAPSLPLRSVRLVVEPGAEIVDVDVIVSGSERIPGTYQVLPCQEPLPIGETGSGIIEPDPEIYGSSEPYPPQVLGSYGAGTMGGYRIASFDVHPVQYTPASGELVIHRQIVVVVTTRPQLMEPIPRTERGQRTATSVVLSTVDNPEDVVRFEPPFTRLALDDEIIEYLIITTESMAGSFEPLREWKEKKGYRSAIRTVEWIDTNYPVGIDTPERIRLYLQTLYPDSGLVWVLLGGDGDFVPHRNAYVGYGYQEFIPADLYFSDMDGDWNADGDDKYGEMDDEVDLEPDVYVGRAPVAYDDQVEDFIQKVLAYERAVSDDYQLKMLFMAESLDETTDAGDAKDLIDEHCVPVHFQPILKLYSGLGNLNIESALAELNAGYGLVNHDGHGNENYMGVGRGYGSGGDDYLTGGHMLSLTNGPRFSFLYTLGCHCGNFEYDDCIIERFVQNPDGGGFAIANSRYGWYVHREPWLLSGEFDEAFFCQLLQMNQYQAGIGHAAAKMTQITRAQQGAHSGCYRYIYYELNLFGDPETPIWTNEVTTLDVTAPDSLLTGEAILCTVMVEEMGAPAEGAVICLSKGDEVYLVGEVGASGEAIFEVTTTRPGPMDLTITYQNSRPHEATISVYTNTPYPMYDSHVIDDENKRAEPGETVPMILTLTNLGNEGATGVWARVTPMPAEPHYITMDIDSAGYPDIPSGGTGVSETPYQFTVSDECPQGTWIPFEMNVYVDGGVHVVDTFKTLVKRKYVLLVDDDAGATYETYFTAPLDALGKIYDVAESPEEARVELPTYEVIVWFTGATVESTLTEDDRQSLQQALDAGVNLFLTGKGIANDIGETDFFRDYLHASFEDEVNESFLDGVEADPVSGGIQIRVTNQQNADVIAPLGDADSCFIFRNASRTGAVRYDGDYHLIYFGFGYEGIRELAGYASPDTVMARVLDHLGGVEEVEVGPPQRGFVFSLGQNAPNPFNNTAKIQYELPQKGEVALRIYNAAGQCVRVLVDGIQNAGRYTVAWDGRDDRDHQVASGVYFYRLTSESGSAAKKMIYLK
jgi:hypothetical protein